MMRFVPDSFSSRIGWLGAIVTTAFLTLAFTVVSANLHTRESFDIVSHTYQVIQVIDEAEASLREAESGQRGFLLTRDPAYTVNFTNAVEQALAGTVALRRLVEDNPAQTVRAAALQDSFRHKIRSLKEPLAETGRGRFDLAAATVQSGVGRRLMDDVARRAARMKAEERSLLAVRMEQAGRRSSWTTTLVIAGGSFVVLLFALSYLLLARAIRGPIEAVLSAMAAFGAGDRSARVTGPVSTAEFSRLAQGYNGLADQLQFAIDRLSERDCQLHRANDELLRKQGELAARGEAIELLGSMAHRMQAARSDEELAAVIGCFAARVLPGVPGALYARNSSRNLLLRLADWGEFEDLPESFAPGDCWSLKRGQSHAVAAVGTDVVCVHATPLAGAYTCEPLLAGGEFIGVIHLKGLVGEDDMFRLTTMAENIASALTNLRLQRGLREQTIRDPLTGLFNRRYMEEALGVEIARAVRSSAPVSVIMCDVDHFKRFNDDHGHDAGDALLRTLSAQLTELFREGDIICRYGGEEFTIISPGVLPATLARRVDLMRDKISGITIKHAGTTIGGVSMSFGIAGWSPDEPRDTATLVQAADAALYRAKRAGRNCVLIADREAA